MFRYSIFGQKKRVKYRLTAALVEIKLNHQDKKKNLLKNKAYWPVKSGVEECCIDPNHVSSASPQINPLKVFLWVNLLNRGCSWTIVSFALEQPPELHTVNTGKAWKDVIDDTDSRKVMRTADCTS